MWQNNTKISSEGLGGLSIYTGSRVGKYDISKWLSGLSLSFKGELSFREGT